MEWLYAFESVRHPVLDLLMQGITFLGQEEVLLVVVLIIAWCVDKRRGYYLMYSVVTGAALNNLLKSVFCIPRPWMRDPEFTIVESAREGASGYSFPSGHTQAASSVYLAAARVFPRTWLKILLVVLTVLVAFSRMYLGVHTPVDVSVSILAGLILVLISAPLFEQFWNTGSIRPLIGLFVLSVSLVLLQILAYDFFLQNPLADPVNSVNCIESAYKIAGLTAGMVLSIAAEAKWVRFDTDHCAWAQVVKLAVGLLVLVAIDKLLKYPLLNLFGGHYFGHSVRYFLVAVWGGLLWPSFFRFFPKPNPPKEELAEEAAA